MKKLKNLFIIFVSFVLFSFSFAQVEDFQGVVSEEIHEPVELEESENVDNVENEYIDEENDWLNLEGISVISQQNDESSELELYDEDDENKENDEYMVNNWSLTREDISEMLWSISISFCNDWVENKTKSLNAVLTEWSPFTTCVVVSNLSKRDITVNLEFSDAWPDQFGTPICYASVWFTDYVLNSDKISQFVVPAENYVVKEAEVLYPIWVDKNQIWCFAIWVEWEQDIRDWEWMELASISRKWILAHYYVWSLTDIKNELEVSNLEKSINENGELVLTFDVKNLWNLENKISVDWIISNIFWFKKSYTSDQLWIDANVLPWRDISVEVNMWLIPNYWGLFNIEFNVTWTPYFSYDVSDDFDKSLLEPLTYTEKTTYFEMPWLIAIIIVVVIILLIVLFRKPKPQVVYVQAPQQPQQPQPQYQQPQYQNPQYQQPVNNQVPQQPQYQQPQQPMQQ